MKDPGLHTLRVLTAALALASGGTSAGTSPLTFTPFHENGIYALDEEAGWTVTAARDSAGTQGKYRYDVRKNNFETIQTGELDLSSGGTKIEITTGEPAMLYVEVSPEGVPGSPIHLGAAVMPSKLLPSVPRPVDFDQFWDKKLKALAKISVNPSLSPVQTGTAGVQLYTVKLDSLGSHVQGYLARPSSKGKFPALVIFQWAGVYALQPSMVTDRAAEGWLAFNVDSHDIPPAQGTGVSTSYQAIGNTDREKSYFLDMYLRDTRAVDYVASRSDWDGKTLVIMGASMGGQQSLAVAGLNSRVTAVIVNEPAGADSNGSLHGHQAGYPNWPSNDPKAMETALYFDTVNFAPRIKAPVLAAIGFIDTVCPPTGIWIALNQIRGPKEVIPMIDSDHNNITPEKQDAFNTRSKEVLRILLEGDGFRPANI